MIDMNNHIEVEKQKVSLVRQLRLYGQFGEPGILLIVNHWSHA